MGAVIAIVFLAVVIVGLVGMMVWRVLKEPLSQPESPDPKLVRPLEETSPEIDLPTGSSLTPAEAQSRLIATIRTFMPSMQAVEDYNEAVQEFLDKVLDPRVKDGTLSDPIGTAARLSGLTFFWGDGFFNPSDRSVVTTDQLPNLAHRWVVGRMEELNCMIESNGVFVNRNRIPVQPEQLSDIELEQLMSIARGPWAEIIKKHNLNQRMAASAGTQACCCIIRSLQGKVPVESLCGIAMAGFMEGTRIAELAWAQAIRLGTTRGTQFDPSTLPSLKIRLFKDGRITVEGRVCTMSELQKQLHETKSKGGIVWYYREESEQEPPRQWRQIMDSIVALGLPITFSTKPDFSDAIGPDGQPRPRNNPSSSRS